LAARRSLLAAHLSDEARDYRDFDYTRPTAFLLGSELWGVSTRAAALADAHVVIPMEGLVNSLNVSVAAALLLYEARRQREAAGYYDACRLPPEVYSRTLFEWSHPEIARRCRERGLPYPPLTEDGDLAGNPFG
jgi:tRNA (guanosine-2'-O-)-methyltransferase